MKSSRRKLLAGLGMGLGRAEAGFATAAAQQQPPAQRKGKPLDIADYQPKSMLHVPETTVARARYPVIDVHTHISSRGSSPESVQPSIPVQELLQVMDRKNIKMLVNLTGGIGAGVKEGVGVFEGAHPGRFLQFTQPHYARMNDPGY